MKETAISIRQATNADAPAVSIIGEQMTCFLRKFYRPSPEARANRQAIAGQLVHFVAVVDDQIVGTVQYYFRQGTLRLVGMAVHEQHRRRGVASTMVEYFVTMARQRGVKVLRLSTVKETGTVPIYRKLGFNVIRETGDGFFVDLNDRPVVEVELELQID